MSEQKEKNTLSRVLWAAGAAAFGLFDWMRIKETLPPGPAELHEMLAAAMNSLPETYTAEYGSDFDLAAQLPEHYGKVQILNEADTEVPGTRYSQIVFSAEAWDASVVKETKTVSILVEDTQAPEVQLKNDYGSVILNGTYDAADNIVSVSDPVDGEIPYSEKLTKNTYTVSYDIDTRKAGIGRAVIEAMDKNGNVTVREYPVTVETYSLADQEHPSEDLPKIAFACERAELAVDQTFVMEDFLKCVKASDGSDLKKSDELTEGTYTLSGFSGDTSRAGVYRITVRAMNDAGDTAAAYLPVRVGTDEEIAAAMHVDPSSGAGQVYLFLTGEAGFSRAAACGIMANISRESGYRPTADNAGLYHGLCQWGGGRLTNLYDWCYNSGYDPESIDGQLHFMMHELETRYTGVLGVLRSVSDDADGAWQAGAAFVSGFEGVSGMEGSTGARAAEMYYTQ